jgi:hypothetical protein
MQINEAGRLPGPTNEPRGFIPSAHDMAIGP